MGTCDGTGRWPVRLELAATTEEGVIGELIGTLAGFPQVRDLRQLERAVLERQRLQPPLLDNGIALPHARTHAVTSMVIAAGRCRNPVGFGPDRVPVRLVFLYGMPADCVGEYLAAVARLMRLLKTPGVLAAMVDARDEAAFRGVLE